jgi:hypothetical protein
VLDTTSLPQSCISTSLIPFHLSPVLPNDKVNVKVKFTLEQATEAQRGVEGIALLFL